MECVRGGVWHMVDAFKWLTDALKLALLLLAAVGDWQRILGLCGLIRITESTISTPASTVAATGTTITTFKC